MDSHTEVTGGAIVSATAIRLDFPSQPQAGGRVRHCGFPCYRNRGLVRDDWHSIRPAKYATVPNVGVVEFPQQRTLAGIPC